MEIDLRLSPATRLSPEEYKCLMCDVKIDTVCDECLHPQIQIESPEEYHTLLMSAIQHTAEYVTKEVEKAKISPQYIQIASKRLQEARQSVSSRGIPRRVIPTKPEAYQALPTEVRKKTKAEDVAKASLGLQDVSIKTSELLDEARLLIRSDFHQGVDRFVKVASSS